MPQLDNPRHERFCRELAKGDCSQAEAYRRTYGDDVTSARQNACNLVTNPDVSARIAELQAQSAKGLVLTLAEKRRFLHAVVTTPVGKIDEDNPLAQSVKYTEAGREIKMPDKLRALELDAKLSGELRETAAPSVTLNLGVFFGGESER